MARDRLADAARLLDSTSLDGLLAVAADTILGDLHVTASMIYLLQPDGWLRLAGLQGYQEGEARAYRWLPPDSPYPVAAAVRERRPVHQLVEALPGIPAERAVSLASFAAFPLLAGGQCLGALLLEVQRASPLPPGDSAAMSSLAGVCAYRAAVLAEPDSAPVGHALRAETRPRTVDGRSSRLEQAMTSADYGVFEWYVQTDALIWDERACRIFGLDPRTLRGQVSTFTDSVHPDDRAIVEAAISASFADGDYAARYRIRQPDGAIRWVEAKGKVRFDGRHRPVALVGVVQDCTADEERHRLIRAATSAFASALGVQDVADAMVDTILPMLRCSGLVVHLSDGDDLVPAAARGYPPDALQRLAALDAASPMAAALRTARTQFFRDRQEYLQAFPAPEFRPAERHRAWAIIPLSTALGPVGTCTMSYTTPQEFNDEERSQLEGLAGILSQSLARAELFEKYQRQMTELQAMMLPRSLSPGPGVPVAVRYLPATDSLDVGGDWYDVVPLTEGRTGVVVGDVQGHNARAAAVMGQMRTAVRAYAAAGHDPTSVVERTNRMLCDLDTDLLATACYVELDPGGGAATIVRAGHPHPLMLAPDGTCRELAVTGGLPLGFDPDTAYAAEVVAMAPGDALLLFTDGLVERRDLDYDAALAGLIRHLAAAARRMVDGGTSVLDGLEYLADHVVAEVPADAPRDDIVVLLAGNRGLG